MSAPGAGDPPLLCPLARGGEPPALFLVPALGNTPLALVHLARAISPPRPVLAFSSQGFEDDRPPHGSIEDMATAYLSELLAAQPEGPYLLGGHCMGGLVALEMVTRLEDAGAQVASLLLFDAMAPFQQIPGPDGAVTERSEAEAGTLLTAISGVIGEALESAQEHFVHLPPEEVRRLQGIRSVHGEASFHYQGRPVRTPVELFRTRTFPDLVLDGWDPLATSGLRRIEVPGETFSMLKPPHAAALGVIIGEILAAACRPGTARPGAA